MPQLQAVRLMQRNGMSWHSKAKTFKGINYATGKEETMVIGFSTAVTQTAQGKLVKYCLSQKLFK